MFWLMLANRITNEDNYNDSCVLSKSPSPFCTNLLPHPCQQEVYNEAYVISCLVDGWECSCKWLFLFLLEGTAQWEPECYGGGNQL